jgi:hypothetical protein
MSTVTRGDVRVTQVVYHRNGIAGEGFYLVRFRWDDEGCARDMLATVFPPPPAESGPDEGEPDWLGRNREFHRPHVAVLDEGMLPNIAFGQNSWRGDEFADALYAAIREHAYRE